VKLLKQPTAFPIVISQPGTYRLKKNITVPDANTTAISVQADNVTIDLNGFAILGPTVCTGSPVTSCAPIGLGDGISVTSAESVTVSNGTIRGMGRDGVALGQHSVVEGLRAISNGDDGIQTGEHCTIRNTVAARNGKDNGGNGIATFSSVVSNNVTEGNRGDGILCFGNGCAVAGNTAKANGNCGIELASSGSVVGNTATENTLGMCFNDNGNSPSGYANNVLNDNNGGNANPQLYGGVQMGTNVCGGDTVCP
jgi:parallel beta-helix repeat protein